MQNKLFPVIILSYQHEVVKIVCITCAKHFQGVRAPPTCGYLSKKNKIINILITFINSPKKCGLRILMNILTSPIIIITIKKYILSI